MIRHPLARRVCAVLLMALPGVTVSCGNPAHTISLNAYRNAVATGTAHVLAAHGIALRARPDCRTPGAREADTGGGFTVHCTGWTAGGKPVIVDGAVRGVGTPGQTERYEITVASRVVAHASCLGTSCRR